MIFGTGFASLDEREDAGEMKKPDSLDAARFTDGHGTDEVFCRPFVKLRACAAGIKFIPALWRSHPHRQIAFPVADKLRGAGLCRTVAISNHARAGWWRADGTLKNFFTVHTSDLSYSSQLRILPGAGRAQRVIFTQNDVRDFGRNRREFYTGSHGLFRRQNEFPSRQQRVANMFTMPLPLQS